MRLYTRFITHNALFSNRTQALLGPCRTNINFCLIRSLQSLNRQKSQFSSVSLYTCSRYQNNNANMKSLSVSDLTCYYCKAHSLQDCERRQELWKCGREATHCVYIEGSYTDGGLLRTNFAKGCATKRDCDPDTVCRTDAGRIDCSVKCCNGSRCNKDISAGPTPPTTPGKFLLNYFPFTNEVAEAVYLCDFQKVVSESESVSENASESMSAYECE